MSKRPGPSDTGSPEHLPPTSSRPTKRVRGPSINLPTSDTFDGQVIDVSATDYPVAGTHHSATANGTSSYPTSLDHHPQPEQPHNRIAHINRASTLSSAGVNHVNAHILINGAHNSSQQGSPFASPVSTPAPAPASASHITGSDDFASPASTAAPHNTANQDFESLEDNQRYQALRQIQRNHATLNHRFAYQYNLDLSGSQYGYSSPQPGPYTPTNTTYQAHLPASMPPHGSFRPRMPHLDLPQIPSQACSGSNVQQYAQMPHQGSFQAPAQASGSSSVHHQVPSYGYMNNTTNLPTLAPAYASTAAVTAGGIGRSPVSAPPTYQMPWANLNAVTTTAVVRAGATPTKPFTYRQNIKVAHTCEPSGTPLLTKYKMGHYTYTQSTGNSEPQEEVTIPAAGGRVEQWWRCNIARCKHCASTATGTDLTASIAKSHNLVGVAVKKSYADKAASAALPTAVQSAITSTRGLVPQQSARSSLSSFLDPQRMASAPTISLQQNQYGSRSGAPPTQQAPARHNTLQMAMQGSSTTSLPCDTTGTIFTSSRNNFRIPPSSQYPASQPSNSMPPPQGPALPLSAVAGPVDGALTRVRGPESAHDDSAPATPHDSPFESTEISVEPEQEQQQPHEQLRTHRSDPMLPTMGDDVDARLARAFQAYNQQQRRNSTAPPAMTILS
ncbi:hypothetical protein LTR78_004629 [Recurvomyces mirabilis]|uniref:Uncharacterized protein n=1 Tax=Recurvomyces mirabilis TaxID=574656 RepID=A0AAE0WPQ7_9PEZI|nr:hypothetical protein LTR78_004629 [Recurvomyces mirabilis]KAK5152878.1 hypothetical protein LTS14_007985 [Recurvomyces mirabilis]